MITKLTEKFPVRRSEAQKAEFRDFAVDFAKESGMSARVEALGKHNNVVIGDPLKAKVTFTAHYDTPCASIVPNLMIPRCVPLFLAYQFLPITLLLAVCLSIGYLVGVVAFNDYRVFAGVYLVLYFGLYFLLFRTFTNKNNVNDNTSGVATVLRLMEKLSDEQKGEVAFILFDNEEKGKLGSKAYNAAHKEMASRLVINFDCVGNGNNVVLIAKPAAERSADYQRLKADFCGNAEFVVEHFPAKGSMSNTDFKSFDMGVSCMACKKTKKGLLYTPYIHTARDVVANEQNVEFITDGMIKFLA